MQNPTAIYLKYFHRENYGKILLIEILTDNQSLVDALKSSKYENEKSFCIDIAALKQYISTNEVTSVNWVNGSEQLSDMLTKHSANSSPLIRFLNWGFILFKVEPE